jgi:rSAM/selenodomain-associated transferase 2
MMYTFSVIIPVLHESASINGTIDHLRNLGKGESLEIIVVDGSPDGDTIAAIVDRDVKRLVAGTGRASQMNRGAAHATGHILLFLHADTFLPGKAFRHIRRALSADSTVAGAFDLGMDSPRLSLKIIAKMASIRSRVMRIPYGDQAQFFRRECFDALEGFRDLPVMEDVDIMRRIKTRRGRIRIIALRVKTSPRRWEREGLFRCTLRNWLLICFYYLGARPEMLSRYYRFGT